MTQNDPPLSKLPDGKIIAFTMEVQDWIDALLWEDEEHDPWVEKNLELRYISDNASDGVPPAARGWELILECAQADYENTKVKDTGELCREIIFTLTGEDPGEWHEKMAKLVFEPPGRGRRLLGEELYVDKGVVENLRKAMKRMVERKRSGW